MNNSLWNKFNTYYLNLPALEMSLDISRMEFEEDFFSKMSSKVDEALKSMGDLIAGAISNPDENRMVGHYWLRDTSLAPSSLIKDQINKTNDVIKLFAKDIHEGKIKGEKGEDFKNVLVVGIGGSALGPQLAYDALGSTKNKCDLYFCDNTDPDGIERIYSNLKGQLDKTLVLVISKSGGTVETRNGMLEFEERYRLDGLKFSKHAVAITCEGSKLDSYAKEHAWLKQIYMWDWVGGRTSLFSAVGLVPLSLLGVNLDSFLSGAKEMDMLSMVSKAEENPAMLLALMWYHAGKGKGEKDMVILPYKDRLVLFSKYLQQLIMESLGKERDLSGAVVNQGIAVYGNKGSTDQHAYIQQLRDGLNNFFAVFIRVLEAVSPLSGRQDLISVEEGLTSSDYLSGFFQGTRKALFENKRESITITVKRLDEVTLGALIALFERAVGFYASFVNINAYHQPGVEAGKKAATKVVEIQKEILNFLATNKGEYSAEKIAENLSLQEEVESIYLTLQHLVANNKASLIKRGRPRDETFSAN